MNSGPSRLLGGPAPKPDLAVVEGKANEIIALCDEMHGAVATLAVGIALTRMCSNLCRQDVAARDALVASCIKIALDYEHTDRQGAEEKKHGE